MGPYQRIPLRKLLELIRYSGFFGVRSVGPVGNFLETIDPNFSVPGHPSTRLCKIARQLMDGETLPDPPERSKGGIPPDFRQPGKKGRDFVDALLSGDFKKKKASFFLFEMIF